MNYFILRDISWIEFNAWPQYIPTIIDVLQDSLSTNEVKSAVALSMLKDTLSRQDMSKVFQDGKTLLILMSCLDTSGELVEYLIMKGAGLEQEDQDGWTALSYAAYYMNIRAVSVLIKHGANLSHADNQESSPILCIISRFFDMYYSERLLLSILYLLKESNHQLLSKACFWVADRESFVPGSRQYELSYKITRNLLEFGAEANYQQEGITMLPRAASVHDEEMSLLLISHGADPRYVHDFIHNAPDLNNNLPPYIKRLWQLFSCQRPAMPLFGQGNAQYLDANTQAYKDDVAKYFPKIYNYVRYCLNNALCDVVQVIQFVKELRQKLEEQRDNLPHLPPEIWRTIIQHISIPIQVYPTSRRYMLTPAETMIVPFEDICDIHPQLSQGSFIYRQK